MGVGDLAALAQDTHRFEPHYSMAGRSVAERRRSMSSAHALLHADRDSLPVIFSRASGQPVVPRLDETRWPALSNNAGRWKAIASCEKANGFPQRPVQGKVSGGHGGVLSPPLSAL